MLRALQYVLFFFLGCLFMANNPELNQKVLKISESLKEKVMSISGKTERNEMKKFEREKNISESKNNNKEDI